MSARAGIVVTGTEVLTGRVTDRNGPWLSDRLREIGMDLAEIVIVGDRPEDMSAALAFFAGQADPAIDLVITSGGLGPTADDLTADVVGRFQGRAMVLDEPLEGRIWAIIERFLSRWPDHSAEALRASNRKQAIVPEGATVLEPVGTAPGLVVPPAGGRNGPTVVVLPGPPSELQPMWSAAVATEAFAAATQGATAYRQHMLRLYGIPESEIAETLRVAEAEHGLGGLEITTCLRRGEVEVVTRFEPAAQETYDAFAATVQARHADTLFSTDGTTVDDQVAAALVARGWTIATAESCTGGLLAGRLTNLPGSSAYVLGGLVVYANAAKSALAGVPAELIEEHGAVSAEVAEALAYGARTALGTDVGVGITGVAGPDGGTDDKPVGLVWLSVAGPESTQDGAQVVPATRRVQMPGNRADIRDRSTTVAMHMVRRFLTP